MKSWLKSFTFLSWIAFVLLFAWPDFYVKAGMMIAGPLLSGVGIFQRYRETRWSRRVIPPLFTFALWILMWSLVLFHAFLERPKWG